MMMTIPWSKRVSGCLFYVALALFNTACSKENMSVPANLTAYNHTENGIGSYIVTLSTGASTSAGYLGPGEGGGGMTCCLAVPPVWRPGMTATIEMETTVNGKDITTTKTVTIPQYATDDVSTFNVHFLHNGNYKVFVSKYALGHRRYPLTGKEAELNPGVPLKIIWE